MSPLTFSHTFKSGRTLVFTAVRRPNQRPLCFSSIQCADLTPDELAEYVPWRNNTVARLMSILTPEEVFACNQSK
jgi:hypothetical protein